MLFHLSLLAYLALVPLLAGGVGTLRPGTLRPGPWLGLAGPWAGFLFLPNDSLPPFLDFAWSGPAFWLALFIGPLAQAGRGLLLSGRAAGRSGNAEILFHLLILVLAWLGLCFYALRRGLPGDLPGLGVFAAAPLLSQAGPAGALGLISLFLALAPFAARRKGDHPGLAMTRLAISAFLTTAFFPFGLSALLETSAPPALALDFFIFWGKVLLLNRFLAPRLAKFPRIFALLGGAAGLALLAAGLAFA
ncbi:MAG: hypothetical protein LBV70_02650 [Candidatus Adiutrix sp.]|jgi:hypothetical protein|nr:hypothetical protein [Candidatus Adiutrix sp.]